MSKRAVIVIDLQNEYTAAGKLPLTGIEAAVANAARVIDDARAKGIAVIHVRHEFAHGEKTGVHARHRWRADPARGRAA